jgi:Ca2+-binding RTX toxin-like protein
LSILSLYEVTFRNGIDYNPNIARNIPGYFDNCLKNNGYIDGKNAYNIANNILHQTPESAIYFAIDANTSKGSVYMDDVINHSNGISRDFSDLSNGHPLFKIDVYGGGDVLDIIYDNGHGIEQYKWLAAATMWAGSKHYSTYDIAQGLEDKTIFPGIRVDPDVTRGSNFGQWGGSPNPPAPSALAFAVAADKGAAGDTLTVAGKGEVGDTVTLFDGAKAIGTAKVPVGGGWSITTAKPLAIGTHGLSVSEVDVAANQSGASPAQSLSFLGATPNQAVFLGTTGKDVFTGGAGNDVFKFSVAALAATDVVKGGGGSDRLYMTSAGAVHAGRVSGVETYRLANGRANSLTLANANFSGVSGRVITVTGGGNGNTVNAAAATGTNRVTLVGGGGKDVFTGGGAATLSILRRRTWQRPTSSRAAAAATGFI